VSRLVIDASVAVKWVVEEAGTAAALTLRRRGTLLAPDLLVAECAHILWTKARRGELSRDEALLAARLLQGADLQLLPTRALLESATRISLDLDHPAYDCLYIALAEINDCSFVTADERLLRKVGQLRGGSFSGRVVALHEAAGPPG
jgi:predicted nucleic acid-binding protein